MQTKRVNCNCDSQLSEWLEDSDFLTFFLSVTQLRVRDTGEATEKGYHTLGKLMCFGRVTDSQPGGGSEEVSSDSAAARNSINTDYRQAEMYSAAHRLTMFKNLKLGNS